MKTILAILLLTIVWTFANQVHADEPRQQIRIGMIDNHRSSFFPFRQLPGQSHYIRELVSPPVIAMDKNWQWVCILCEEIPTTENSKVRINNKSKFPFVTEWRLRSDLKWADGTAVTGHDIKYAMGILFRQTRESELPGLPVFKVDVHPKDPLKFYISFQEPRYDYYQIMAVSLLPAHLQEEVNLLIEQLDKGQDLNTVAKKFESPGLYYGPYIIEKIEPQAIKLIQNPHYAKKVHTYRSLQITFRKDVRGLEEELKAGRIDMVVENTVDIQQAVNILSKNAFIDKNYRIISFPSSWLDQLVVNLRNPYLSDPNMRKALLIALDRDRLVQQAYHNHGAPAFHLTPPLKQPDNRMRMYPYNQELAKILLDNLGWKSVSGGKRNRHGQLLQIEIVVGQDPYHQSLVRLIQEDWQAIGIDVRIQTFKNSDFVDKILKARRFRDIALVRLPHSPDSYWYGRFHRSSVPSEENFYHGFNIGTWQNKVFDRLLEKFQKTYHGPDRQFIEMKLKNIILSDLPILPLVYNPKVMIVRESIGNVRLSGHHFHSSLFSNEWTSTSKEQGVF